jgi:hypothetical protein
MLAGMRRGGGRTIWVALSLVGVVVVALVLAQVFLPGIAASRIRARVARYGMVESVSVSAWPAVKLLWGSADSVSVRTKSLQGSQGQAAALLWEARRLGKVKLTAASARVGRLAFGDVSLEKHGDRLSVQARMTDADVRAALPEGFDGRLVKSEEGEVELSVSGALFGVGATVNAVASASEGKLVVRPRGFLIEALQLTLFEAPHVYVESVSASGEPGQSLTYRVSVGASLR